jgi:flagellar biosynthesis protein FlhA
MKDNKASVPVWKTVVIPIALVTIITILVLPIPTFLLDIFLALNITISLVILFSSLYIDRPLEFSSFPAILLISTLFRLSMNVATTRLILINGADGTSAAGEVIKAFGEFVVAGNFTVGVVVFVLISIVNIKVITKGSSRIAEVAARFTLDAMPGKQMAIDSDLSSGLINEAEAKRKRKELSMEAEFYGAMDGSAKFVSGDAVAGILITAINIIGGLFIGVFFNGMDWYSAAEAYTLLTIGDGLVSQIPSIIVSTASGLIVARASTGEDLGSEIIGQISGNTKPLLFTSAVSGLFALIPGLPFIPFVALSLGFGGLAYVRNGVIKGEKESNDKSLGSVGGGNSVSEQAQLDKPKPGSSEEVLGLLGVDTLELEVGFELVSLVEGGELLERIRSLRRQFALDYGFVIPPIYIRDNLRLDSNGYQLLLRGSQIGSGKLMVRHHLAMNPGSVTAPIKGVKTKEPAFGLDALWIADSDKSRALQSGYTVVDLPTVITTHLTELLRKHMHELLGREETQQLIDAVAKDKPKVVEELIPSMLTLGQVRQVLSRLLKEDISIRDMTTILETLADWANQIKSPEKLAEVVRRALARNIVSKFMTQQGSLPLISLSPTCEKALTDSLQQGEDGSFLALEPSQGQNLISKLTKAAEKFMENGYSPLVLVSAHLRPALFTFASRYVPVYSVISPYELLSSVKVQSLGVVSLNE